VKLGDASEAKDFLQEAGRPLTTPSALHDLSLFQQVAGVACDGFGVTLFMTHMELEL
jgi:hypothetical protein